MMWVRREEISNSGVGDAILYILTGMGHQSVMIFFVLSGFLVGGSILRPSFSWRYYVIARISRLWVVLIPCLLFTFLIGNFTGVSWNSYSDSRYDASFATFIGNLVFLQTIAVPVFGGNEPLWSLANEFWYYALFPLLISRRILLVLLGILIALLLPSPIQIGFLIWLQGVAAYLFVSRASPSFRLAVSRTFWVILLLFVAALLYSKSPTFQSRLRINPDLLVGGSFALICTSLSERPPILSKFARQISDMSYSLYLTHYPVVVLIGTYFYPSKLVPTFALVLQFLAWLAALLLVGWVFWWLFERHTDSLRRQILRVVPNG